MALTLAFFATALLYASVGFGGGSTYTALLALVGTDFRILPFVSLVCNVIVVTGGTIRFARAGLLPWRRALPLVAVSTPLALLGGLTPIRETTFMLLLGVSLIAAGILLLIQRERAVVQADRHNSPLIEPGLGGAIGYLSGLVGIGGGIFLAPILHMMRWGSAREIAATASLFILVNSLAGLIGQGLKLRAGGELAQVVDYWPLALAVLIGGQIGSWAGIAKLPQALVRRLTAVLIIAVAVQLLWKMLLA
ncbi:MAG: sulfite exporter TauE/SafE family protein [Sphingomonadaceae bacterium]